MDKFNTLKMFIAVADHGSFGAASTALGTDPSTISKALSRLEEQLEYQLFYRSTRKLKITEAGQHYLVTVRKLLIELGESEKQLARSNNSASGLLKINLPVAYGRLYIQPMLSDFCRLYPDIQLNVTFSDEYEDIIEQGIDVSIRTGTVADSRLVMQKLSPMDFFICASPDYLDNHDEIERVADLVSHPWIRFRFKQTGKLMPILVKQADDLEAPPQYIDPGNQYEVDDGQALVELCKNGLGLMQGPHFIFREELQSGALIPLFPMTQPEGFGVFILYPKRRFLPKKVSVFIEFVKASLADLDESANYSWARELVPKNTWS
jgi:DNA-binding transcriptional LysR family regulator